MRHIARQIDRHIGAILLSQMEVFYVIGAIVAANGFLWWIFDGRFKGIEDRFRDVDRRFDKLEDRLNNIDRALFGLQGEIRGRRQAEMDQQLSVLVRRDDDET